MCMGNEKAKLSLRSEVLLGALALVVIVGLTTGVYAAPKNADKSQSDQTTYLDPFTLQSTLLSVNESADGSKSVQGQVVVLGSTVDVTETKIAPVIPYRLPCRSPFRVPLVPSSS